MRLLGHLVDLMLTELDVAATDHLKADSAPMADTTESTLGSLERPGRSKEPKWRR